MNERVYKKIRVVGCSRESYEQAIRAALSKASGSLHGMAWFEVVEHRGALVDGGVVEWQATLDVAFKLD